MHPTHYCTGCGALWRQCDDGSWNLRSEKAGPCCDNVPMGEQIQPLAAPAAQQGAQGWKLVPETPTAQMIHAAGHNWVDQAKTYRAMLSASPQAPAQRADGITGESA